MKRYLYIAAALAVLAAAAALVVSKRFPERSWRSAELAPPDAIFFAELPDLSRSGQRWPQTGLGQLWSEPEVQAFLKKPREKLPAAHETEQRLDDFAQVKPRQAFVAVTSLTADLPRFVAGIRFDGGLAALDHLLTSVRAEFQKAHPAGKADLESYGGVEIQTYRDTGFVLAGGAVGHWCFVANDLELLHQAVDRCALRKGASTACLDDQPGFREAMAPLASEPDLALYARTDLLVERWGSLMGAAGQAADPKQLEEMRKMKAIAASSKMDGADFRDTWFFHAPGEPSQPVLPLAGLALTSADTVLLYSHAISPDFGADLQKSPAIQMIPPLAEFNRLLTAKDLSIDEFGSALGPELSIVLDWTVNAQPQLCLAVDLRHPEKARVALEAVVASEGKDSAWTRSMHGDVALYQAQPEGLIQIAPTVAISERLLLVGLSEEGVGATLDGLGASHPNLSAKPAYQAAYRTVPPPTQSFAYLETGEIVNRSFPALRAFLVMSLALGSDIGQYIDFGKLPSAKTLSKHLGTTIYSQTATPKGVLIESRGALTFQQVASLALIGGGAAYFPQLKETFDHALQPGGPTPATPVLAPAPAPATAAPATPAPALATPAPAAQAAQAAPTQPASPAPAPTPDAGSDAGASPPAKARETDAK